MSKELLQQAIDFAEYCLEELELSYMASNQAKRLIEKSEEALAKQEQDEPDWKALVFNHNAECESRCNMDSCGYKPYFEYSKRRCPNCPVHEMIDVEYTTPQPAQKPLTDEQIWKFWWNKPEVPEGEDDSMEAQFVAAVRAVLAHGIKENT